MAYNPYIVIPLASWAIAQITKFAIAALRGKVDFRTLYASGGMPSVHSAVVCSLAVTAYLIDGPNSGIFGLAAILAAIVMYDSFGVRRSTGEQAAAINMMLEGLDRNRVKLSQPGLHLREVLGHQPREVVVGALLGVALAGLFNYERLGSLGLFFQVIPSRSETLIYAGVFGALILIGIISRFVLRARNPKSKTMKKVATKVLAGTQVIGWIGLASSVLVYERASYLAWRLWPVLVLGILLFWLIWLFSSSYRTVPALLEAEANDERKHKWLSWGKGRHKNKK